MNGWKEVLLLLWMNGWVVWMLCTYVSIISFYVRMDEWYDCYYGWMYEQLDCCYEWMDDEYIGAPLYNLQEQEKDAAKTCFWSQYGRWARKAEEKKQTILDREEKQDICIMYYMYIKGSKSCVLWIIIRSHVLIIFNYVHICVDVREWDRNCERKRTRWNGKKDI